MKIKRTLYRVFILLLGLLAGAPLAADDNTYDIEIVVFERPGGGGGEFWPADPGVPDRTAAIGRLEDRAVAGKSLGPVAYTLNKKGMIVHDHLAWRLKPGGRDSNTWYWMGDDRLSGLIRISRGRFLHLDTDLVLIDRNTGQPYRIKLHRRMRSNELHYEDHPRLGILIRAKPYRTASSSDDAADNSSGEPKPVTPLGAGQPG
jgi:hypothetical protein